MTDRVKGFVITLDESMRDDDVEIVANAIRMIKRVKAVDPVPVGIGISDWLVKTDTARDLRTKILKVIDADLHAWS